MGEGFVDFKLMKRLMTDNKHRGLWSRSSNHYNPLGGLYKECVIPAMTLLLCIHTLTSATSRRFLYDIFISTFFNQSA
jgi:hypothetical protein